MSSNVAALILASTLLLLVPNIASSGSTSTATSAGAAKPSSGSKKTASSKAKKSKHRSARPAYQGHPTAERYREIQQALADKGYFKGQVNGSWGEDSVEALKKFQTDHQIAEDGKINSVSLIQLGLGPKHETAGPPSAAAPAALPADVQPQSKISE